MLNAKYNNILEKLTDKNRFRSWRVRRKLKHIVPRETRAKVVIVNLSTDPLNVPGKVTPEIFFPPFCKILAQCGISTSYVCDNDSLEREVFAKNAVPRILINLIHELYDDPETYSLSEDIIKNTQAIFNSNQTARIIRDKKKANILLSKHGIPMPKFEIEKGRKIFSNARYGSKEQVYVHDSLKETNGDRYNTEYIDTRIRFGELEYYTVLRLMSIGTHLLQVFARASDVRKSNPSVHNADTPQERELLNHLNEILVAPRLPACSLLAEKIGLVLGPGFYAHDVLVDQESGKLLLCETGLKFFDNLYSSRVMGLVDDRSFQMNILDQKTYAAYAGAVFVAYCTKMGII